jgi:hypothetical protein
MFETREWKGEIRREGNTRLVVLPDEVIPEGNEILIVQDKWGEISIHPASPEGRRALDQFGPFADWSDEDHAASRETVDASPASREERLKGVP